MEQEQDTVLQLQEVIEQLRNVFPSEPGEHLLVLHICFQRHSLFDGQRGA